VLQESVARTDTAGKDASLNINIAKTMTLLLGNTDIEKPIVISESFGESFTVPIPKCEGRLHSLSHDDFRGISISCVFS